MAIYCDDVFDSCMDFVDLCKDGSHKVAYIDSEWHILFIKICKQLGIKRKSAEILFDDMCCGNWTHLHQTDEERKRTADDWLSEFAGDVWYCSDRWSVDRLMRAHWQFRQWRDKVM